VKDDLQVLGLGLGFGQELEVPSGMKPGLHSVQTGAVELRGLEDCVVLGGEDVASDEELLMLVLAGCFRVHQDLVLDVVQLFEGVVVAVMVLFEEGRTALGEELVAGAARHAEVGFGVHEVVEDGVASHVVSPESLRMSKAEVNTVRRDKGKGVESDLYLLKLVELELFELLELQILLVVGNVSGLLLDLQVVLGGLLQEEDVRVAAELHLPALQGDEAAVSRLTYMLIERSFTTSPSATLSNLPAYSAKYKFLSSSAKASLW
jgi:hypothetical protein